jgi:hypothetical protein
LKSLRRFQHASGRPDGQSEVGSMIEPGLGYTWTADRSGECPWADLTRRCNVRVPPRL